MGVRFEGVSGGDTIDDGVGEVMGDISTEEDTGGSIGNCIIGHRTSDERVFGEPIGDEIDISGD